MTEFVRPIQERIEDILVLDIEALCDFADNLQYHIPDSLSESKLHATHSSILEESANGLVVGETSCRREQIVLHGCDGSHSNLRGEVAHLVLSQSEVPFIFLKDDFQRPTLGVNPVSLEEVYLAVGGDESVPFSPLAALAEKQTDIAAGKDHVHSDVPASPTRAKSSSIWLIPSVMPMNKPLKNTYLCSVIPRRPCLRIPRGSCFLYTLRYLILPPPCTQGFRPRKASAVLTTYRRYMMQK